ncbi:hypothetical protein ACFC0X_25025 [Paenibacillus chitinolyticus]|uniref:hypothetical protein n=1 Tax=Paenibacillus chitinolyticus TaxID=79263 RepID=UPI0035D963C4
MGYTGLDIDGNLTLRTETLGGVTLAGGDVTLSADQAKPGRIEVATGHATNAVIVPKTPGKAYIVKNNDGTLVASIKVAGGTAVSVAAGKTAIVQVNGAGTQVERVTPDA